MCVYVYVPACVLLWFCGFVVDVFLVYCLALRMRHTHLHTHTLTPAPWVSWTSVASAKLYVMPQYSQKTHLLMGDSALKFQFVGPKRSNILSSFLFVLFSFFLFFLCKALWWNMIEFGSSISDIRQNAAVIVRGQGKGLAQTRNKNR